MEITEKMFDTHIHTKPFSTDSSLSIEEVQKISTQTGLGIVLTEHMDYDFPPPDVYEFNPDTYFQNYAFCRNDQFLLGVEIGLQSIALEKNKKFVNSYPFDMVIGSVHVVCQQDLYYPSYFSMFADKKSAYAAYLETIYENIRCFNDFDTLAHIDYICRKAPYADPLLYDQEFREQIDMILEHLACQEKSLEINTRLFGKQEAVQELEKICRRFRELGGRTVTVGSDAHHAAAVGSCIPEAYALGIRCDLIPVVYRERKACEVTNLQI